MRALRSMMSIFVLIVSPHGIQKTDNKFTRKKTAGQIENEKGAESCTLYYVLENATHAACYIDAPTGQRMQFFIHYRNDAMVWCGG